MKRLFSTVFATAFVVGTVCTAQAANPFSDVPAGHWAYDSIGRLAAAGVIEGYGDDTFRGDRLMTRYEMAQIVARAMAKGANVDKLAAEFANELDNLGVRISSLEKNSDNVIWKGSLLARYWHSRKKDEGELKQRENKLLTARLEPTFLINDNWTGHARFEMNHDIGGAESPLQTKRMWIQGDYKNFQIRMGRLPQWSNVDDGMIYDDNLDAIQATYGSKIKATVTAGKSTRFDGIIDQEAADPISGKYVGVEVYNDRADKFTWGLGFHYWKDDKTNTMYEECGTSSISIYEFGLGYKFDKNWALNGAYAFTNSPDAEHEPGKLPEKCSNDSKKAYSIELDYKKARPTVKDSYGLFVAYRQLGHYAVVAPTYDAIAHGERGFEIGGSYVVAKNMVATVRYFFGKKMHDEDGPGEENQSSKRLYAEFTSYF